MFFIVVSLLHSYGSLQSAVDLGLHDTVYVVAHLHVGLSLHSLFIIVIIMYCYYPCLFPKAFFLGFNVMPRRVPSFALSFHSSTDRKGQFGREGSM